MSTGKGQDLKQAKIYANFINIEDLKKHINVLTHDSLAGRGLGSKGLKKASFYISQRFKKLQIKSPSYNSYLQEFKIIRESQGETYLKFNNKKYANYDQFIYLGSADIPEEEESRLIYYSKLQYFKDSSLVNTSVAAFPASKPYGGFRTNNWPEAFLLISNKGEAGNKIAFSTLKESRTNDYYFPGKVKVAKQEQISFLAEPSFVANALGVSLKRLMSWEKNEPGKVPLAKMKPLPFFFKAAREYDTLTVANVLGYIEGKEKKDELIVISAHYDHLGKTDSTFYPGADDNASGISALLEITEAFKIAKNEGYGPKRSILMIAFTGEEKGLFGSKYYTNNPLFPLQNTVANLNIDMIGRVDNFYPGKEPYIYLIGANKISQELHDLSESVNEKTLQFQLDYRYNAEDDPNQFYYRSDHYNFAKNGIPVIFYFNGTHSDYHEVTDTANKIEFNLLQKRAQLIFYTAWELANRENRLKIDN
jgi:hypothetical protein